MTAIVLDHEQSYQEGGGRQGQQERQPVGIMDGQGHCRPKAGEGDNRAKQLQGAPPKIRRGVTAGDSEPTA